MRRVGAELVGFLMLWQALRYTRAAALYRPLIPKRRQKTTMTIPAMRQEIAIRGGYQASAAALTP